jgi:hypothetical protein
VDAGRKRDGLRGTVQRRAGDDHLHDACGPGTREDRIAIGIVAVMGEVDADVDELCAAAGGAGAWACVMVRHVRTFYRIRCCGSRRAFALTLAVLGLATVRAQAEEGQWRDIESRIQYGYYTQDTRALQNLATATASEEAHDKWHGYYAALANWRLAQLAVLHPSPKAADVGSLAERCTHEVDRALAQSEDFAEALGAARDLRSNAAGQWRPARAICRAPAAQGSRSCAGAGA